MIRRPPGPFPKTLGLAVVLGLLLAGCGGPPPLSREVRSASASATEITALAYTPDGQTLVTRGTDAIRIWDAASLQVRGTLPGDQSPAGALAISPDGRALAAPLTGRGIVAWDLQDRHEVATYPRPQTGPAPAVPTARFGAGVAFGPGGQTLAGPGPTPEAPALALYDRTTGEATGLGAPGAPMTQVAFTPDGRTLVAKGIEGRIRTWDLATRAERRTIAASASYLTALAVSPDSRVVATSGSDRYLRLYRIDDGTEVGKFKGHLKAILGIAYHPSGRWIATGDSGGVIYLWDAASGRILAQFEGHEGKVWALAFRPDGEELASAGQDHRLRVWSVAAFLKAANP